MFLLSQVAKKISSTLLKPWEVNSFWSHNSSLPVYPKFSFKMWPSRTILVTSFDCSGVIFKSEGVAGLVSHFGRKLILPIRF